LGSANPDVAKQIYVAAKMEDVARLLQLRALAPEMVTASLARSAIQVRNACDPQIIVASFPASMTQLQLAMQPWDEKRSQLSGLSFSQSSVGVGQGGDGVTFSAIPFEK
jgi:hypothetical protein